MNVFAKFDEIPSMILEVIKKTKRYRHTFVRSDSRSFVRTDNVKTVYPPTNTVCGGYNNLYLTQSGKVVQVLITVILSIINYCDSNSFMHMFNMSTLCIQSVK